MEETYGARAKEVLYRSKNAGKITGIDSFEPHEACDDADVEAAMDSLRNDAKLDAALSGASILDNRASMMCDDHRVIGGMGGDMPNHRAVRLGAEVDANTKIPMPKDPKERAEYEAAIKRREAAGGGKFVGDK